MAIKKISLCWISVSDSAKAKQFFHDTCGLEIADDASEHGWLEFVGEEGGMTLGVAIASEDKKETVGINAVVTLTVDDIVATKKQMEQKGVRFIGDIMEVPGHVKLATFVDPDNNTFQLVEEITPKHSDGCC